MGLARIAELRRIAKEEKDPLLREALDGWEAALLDLRDNWREWPVEADLKRERDEAREITDEVRSDRDGLLAEVQRLRKIADDYKRERDEARDLVKRLMDVDRINADGEHEPGRQHEAGQEAEAKLREWGMT